MSNDKVSNLTNKGESCHRFHLEESNAKCEIIEQRKLFTTSSLDYSVSLLVSHSGKRFAIVEAIYGFEAVDSTESQSRTQASVANKPSHDGARVESPRILVHYRFKQVKEVHGE